MPHTNYYLYKNVYWLFSCDSNLAGFSLFYFTSLLNLATLILQHLLFLQINEVCNIIVHIFIDLDRV